VYIKQLELSHFKSFGSTTAIPLLPGFTVVSGPNGSGKSNLLDALLFALGLSGSKGMRAERLPDLVNHAKSMRGHAIVETRVTVTFDLSDQLEAKISAHPPDPREAQTKVQEWQITRKLRVTKQGTYTSTYYINDQPCTLTELHEQLNRLRIYPEGYNVVLQGDVTSIISMNSRQRREIIDELAGVADFDRKINQATEKLDTVKEREDRFRIVENELIDQRDRLARDRSQAEKYQKLRAELQAQEQWEVVLVWRDSQKQVQQLTQQLAAGARTQAELKARLATLSSEIQQTTSELEQLNAQVKALGEEEQLALQSTMASREAELRQLQRQQQELEQTRQATAAQILHTQQEIQSQIQLLQQLAQEQQRVETQDLAFVRQQRDQAQRLLDESRSEASAIAANAEAWVHQQTQLHQQIETLLQILDPQRAEQARLRERVHQLERQVQEQTDAWQLLTQEMAEKQVQLAQVQADDQQQQEQVQAQARQVAIADQDLKIQQETQARLLREQREKQRQLDKLEAQQQAQQEVQGTYATRLILKAAISGVCGLVAQLGQVEPQYQLALEVAAGARLGHIVVEDAAVAAAGIEILKRERAGRATFLPLNQMQASRSLPTLHSPEAIDYALHLVDFDRRYQNIFAYVFGNTVVFATLNQARRYLGQYRMVTLEGDLLEATGAMTGGSRSTQQTIHFGTLETRESAEITALKHRLQEIEQLLNHLGQQLATTQMRLNQETQQLATSRQQQRETQLRAEQLAAELGGLSLRCSRLQAQLQEHTQELTAAYNRLQGLEVELPDQEAQLGQWRQTLAELEQSQTHSEWQQIQKLIQVQEVALNEQELVLRNTHQRLQDLENQQRRLQEQLQQGQANLQTYRAQQTAQLNQQADYQQQQQTLEAAIANLQKDLSQLEQTLGAEKQVRDRVERQLRERTTAHQQLAWQLQKLQESHQSHQSELATLEAQLAIQAAELPAPLPDVPVDLELEQLRQSLRTQQKRLQAMEPVNMLAIAEYERTQGRLEELSQKLETLAGERTELLLRIENFTTLRHQAFREAFNAVNQNFQTIFAELSDGDGYLQLEDPEDPFKGGLNLVAHPKGKPVQRLASMSGGEKSLTALSFIFALQRYRPSPFYAFDEVDMFLDGANVERLSKMIQKQAEQAQFIVVSLRRPMVESADRTIGVTQARGTHTQVLGLQLRPLSS
jgi:chromosome segregation protein